MTPLALYIHWPFCLSICPYCDFNRYLATSGSWTLQGALQAYLKELDTWLEILGTRSLTSIFIGGGTPSLMDPVLLKELLKGISQRFSCSLDSIEVTMEANPSSAEGKKLQSFRQAGINRLSIGVQSFDDQILSFLGRKHCAQEAIDVIKIAKTIFPEISFDLIYGHKHHNTDSWKTELNQALALAGHHVSLYQLTIEPQTPFFHLQKQGKTLLLTDDAMADLYLLTDEILKEQGWQSYEISNYTYSQKPCRHNMAYWQYEDYLGLGPGAHSRLCFFTEGQLGRYAIANKKHPDSWMQEVDLQGKGVQQMERLGPEQQAQEKLLMGLRLEKGLGLNKLKQDESAIQKYSLSSFFLEKVCHLKESSLIELLTDDLVLSLEGKLRLDTILRYLFKDLILADLK